MERTNSLLAASSLYAGKLMSLLVHCHGNMSVEVKTYDNAVHGQSADVHALLVLFYDREATRHMILKKKCCESMGFLWLRHSSAILPASCSLGKGLQRNHRVS